MIIYPLVFIIMREDRTLNWGQS